MEGRKMMKCPWTGRVFTNAALYRQHVRTWPDTAKVNGLNLDGTPATATPQEPETGLDNAPEHLDNSEATNGDALPLTLEDVLIDGTRDHKILDALYGAGIGNVATIQGMTDDELNAVPGIGPASITRLREVTGDA